MAACSRCGWNGCYCDESRSATCEIKNNGNIEAASKVGKLIAERALSSGVKKCAFDRNGYLYHGRVKAVAEAVREKGIKI